MRNHCTLFLWSNLQSWIFFLCGAGNRFANRSITKRRNATPRLAPSCDVSPGNDSDTIYEKTRRLPSLQSLRSAKTSDLYQISSRSRQRVLIEPDLPPSPVMGSSTCEILAPNQDVDFTTFTPQSSYSSTEIVDRSSAGYFPARVSVVHDVSIVVLKKAL
jgi:hypothetical protein